MSLDADAIVDRRRLRRKLTLWRTLAVAAVVALIAGIYATTGGAGYFGEFAVARRSRHDRRRNPI